VIRAPLRYTRALANWPPSQTYRLACDSSVPTYEVCLIEDLLGANSHFLARILTHRKSLIVSTPTVERLFGARLQKALEAWELDAEVFVLACNEATKSVEQVFGICQAAMDRRLGRTDVLVSFGGGICSDIVTLAASLIRRGIGHVRIPTTLIGQVDAGIGIKGGINFGDKKNYLGCFYSPEQVLIDPAYLRSVSRSDLSSGFAEIIKLAIVCDRNLFDEVADSGNRLLASGFVTPWESSRRIVWRACQLMLDELAANVYEDQSYQRLVDFGHTFSPHLEALSKYRIPHGHAVAIDMVTSAAISCVMGLLAAQEFEAIVKLLVDLELPTGSPLLDVDACMEAIREAARHRGGTPNLVIPVHIGSATFVEHIADLPQSLIRAALAYVSRVGNRRCNDTDTVGCAGPAA
jgi:2-epi-5-epi-valiolone synthase